MLIQADELTSFVTQLLTTAGADREVAQEVAEHLVQANLKGHDSHGVGMLPAYMHSISNGFLDPGAHAEVIRDQNSIMLVDGRMGFGQVVGREATELAIQRARENALVCLGLRNAHHLGRIGTYGEMCGQAGLVSIHFVNVVGHEPQVAPWGGRERCMTTNPFCCVVPRLDDDPIVLDMATSEVALGKVRVAHMQGVPVPEGALVDASGKPTTDASVMFEEPFGALGPFGKHKGSGLALMCELLGGALAGEWTAQPAHERVGTIVNHMLMFVLDPAAFGNPEAFQQEVLAMADYLHGTEPAEGFDKVRIAGDPERESLAVRLAQGIPVDDNTWAGLAQIAETLNVAIPAGD